MKRIKSEDLPKVLDEQTIDILAHMADEVPQSEEWYSIFDLLNPEDYRRVMDRRLELQSELQKKKNEAMTEQEKKEDEEKWRRIREDKIPRFYGNMGEPETPEQYKDKYGVYPPGYDETGKKISE
jgi:hypothetical protein